MTQNVASLYGGPKGIPERNDLCIQALEEWLEKAKAGQVVGVVIAGLYHDKLAGWTSGGFVGGYAILGALDDAHASALGLVRAG